MLAALPTEWEGVVAGIRSGIGKRCHILFIFFLLSFLSYHTWIKDGCDVGWGHTSPIEVDFTDPILNHLPQEPGYNLGWDH